MTSPFAAGRRVSHYAQFVAAIRERIIELDVPYETVEHIAGLQPRYLTKLMSGTASKRMGQFTMFVILQSLGLVAVLHEDARLVAQLKNRLKKRSSRRMLTTLSMWPTKWVKTVELLPDQLRINGKIGNAARQQSLTKAERKDIAVRAANARWFAVRRAKRQRKLDRQLQAQL